MSCSNLFMKYNKITHRYDAIPCGWCIQCRIAKRMYYKARFEYSLYKEHKGNGAFLTITYDDNNLPLSSVNCMPTLVKSDAQKFIKRVRSYINYYKVDFPLVQKDFKYICVGEYGEDLGRCHYHFLFSGLDYAEALPIFRACWKKAVIFDSKPILEGGVNYVLKYLDKQQHGEQIQNEYLDQGREPPFMLVSNSFGFGLYNNYDPFSLTYRYGSKVLPLPPYIKNKLLAYSPRKLDSSICEYASKNHMSYDDAKKYFVRAKTNSIVKLTRMNGEPIEDQPFSNEFNASLVMRGRSF